MRQSAVAPDGSVYVAGITADGGGDAVLLKFDPNGNLLWERAWGGTESDSAGAVATHSDGSVYVAGRTTSFGPSFSGLFVLKFDPAGSLVWQRHWDDAAGFESMAVTPDGSVYAASSRVRPDSGFSQFDVMVLKLTPAGRLRLGTDVRGGRSRGCARRNGRRRGRVDIHGWRHSGGEGGITASLHSS